MKKQKTQLRPLTLSRLATLTNADLKRAAGGDEPVVLSSANTQLNFVNAQ